MLLNYDIKTYEYSLEIDLDVLYKLDWVLGADDLEEAIMVAVSESLIKHGVGMSEVNFDWIEDSDAGVFSFPAEVELGDIAKFVWHLLNESMGYERGKYFAYVDGVGWKWVNFDNLNTIYEMFHSEYDGDAGEFAREHMENVGETIPGWMESYFDYDSYGEALLEDYDVFEWEGQQYVFSR